MALKENKILTENLSAYVHWLKRKIRERVFGDETYGFQSLAFLF